MKKIFSIIQFINLEILERVNRDDCHKNTRRMSGKYSKSDKISSKKGGYKKLRRNRNAPYDF